MRRTRIPEKFIEASLPCAEAWGLDKKREAVGGGSFGSRKRARGGWGWEGGICGYRTKALTLQAGFGGLVVFWGGVGVNLFSLVEDE